MSYFASVNRTFQIVGTIALCAFFSAIYFGVEGYTLSEMSQKLHRLMTRSLTLDQRTRSVGCTTDTIMPDHACTPGAIFPNVTAQEVCAQGYSASVRNVSTATKNAVYASYDIAHHKTGEYEVDHFISLELGGSNDVANLWPEGAIPVPGFHEKDEVENFLHDQVCTGELTLPQAQELIDDHWHDVYELLH